MPHWSSGVPRGCGTAAEGGGVRVAVLLKHRTESWQCSIRNTRPPRWVKARPAYDLLAAVASVAMAAKTASDNSEKVE